MTRMDDGVTLSCRSRSAAGGGGTDSVTIRVYCEWGGGPQWGDWEHWEHWEGLWGALGVLGWGYVGHWECSVQTGSECDVGQAMLWGWECCAMGQAML